MAGLFLFWVKEVALRDGLFWLYTSALFSAIHKDVAFEFLISVINIF